MTRPLLLAAALAAACNVSVDPQFRVKDVRVLAVRSSVTAGASADVSPGDTLVLEALVANPLGRPDLSIDWFACPPRADEGVPACADLATLGDPARLAANPDVRFVGSGPRVEYPLPDLGAALAFVVETARRQPTFRCRLYAELPVVVVARAGGKSSLAMKTVRVLPTAEQLAGVPTHYALNLNPSILEVARAPADEDSCSGGTAVAAGSFPAGETVVCGRSGPGAQDAFELCNPDGTRTPAVEDLTWQWYVTDGDFPEEGGIGNARGEAVDFTRPPGAFTLWAIVRDGRGGDDWVTVLVSAL